MNPKQQAARDYLRQIASQPLMSKHPLSVTNAKELDSLITELEADGKRLDWMDKMEAHASDSNRRLFTVYEIPPFTQRKVKDLRQAIDAAMKGAA